MRDSYLEVFVTSETQAQLEEKKLRERFTDVGYYDCRNGYVVWAWRESEVDE